MQKVYATSAGKLTTVADGDVIAELISVPSATQITIRLLLPSGVSAIA
jgi:hypothetical protein